MKLQRITLAAAALALAAASVAFGSASGDDSTKTIRAVLQYTGLTEIDGDRNGKPSVGDSAIAPAVYLNAAGKRLGHGSAICVQVNAAGTQYACEGQNHFPGGDIFHAVRFSVAGKNFRGAVLGGTGVYAGLRGTYDGRWLAADFSRARVVFTLHR